MAETQGQTGFGVHLARGDGASPETFTNLAEVIDLTPPAISKDAVEATHTDSPGEWREFIAGLKDGGEFSVVCNWLVGNSTQNNDSGGALNDFASETVARNWRITFPGSPALTWTMKALITEYQPLAPLDDRMTLNITFKVTGQPVFA